VATDADGKNPPSVSAMDIGREFFGNIDEIAVFALAPAGEAQSAAGFPEVGVVIVVKDPEKSEVLWNQILSLAAVLGARTSEPVAEITIEGKAGHVYRFDGIPPLAVVRSGERGLVIGTEGAVAASLRAVASKESIIQDEAFAALLGRLTPTTSKAVLVDVARALAIAAALGGGNDLRQVAALTSDLKVSLVTDEAANQLTIDAEITGLPKLRSLMPLFNGGPRGAVSARK
jgi:hypothetical protein